MSQCQAPGHVWCLAPDAAARDTPGSGTDSAERDVAPWPPAAGGREEQRASRHAGHGRDGRGRCLAPGPGPSGHDGVRHRQGREGRA